MPRRLIPRLGSSWTARQTTWGWRHFQVKNIKRHAQFTFVELGAVCDPKVRFWLNAQQLADREVWQPGWQPRHSPSVQEQLADPCPSPDAEH